MARLLTVARRRRVNPCFISRRPTSNPSGVYPRNQDREGGRLRFGGFRDVPLTPMANETNAKVQELKT